jgi:hypothetical protein
MTPLELWLEDEELGVVQGDKHDRHRRRLAARGVVAVTVRVPTWAVEEIKDLAALRLGQHVENGFAMPEIIDLEVSGPPSGNTGGITPHPNPLFLSGDKD